MPLRKSQLLTPAQLRAARGLLGWSQAELAAAAGVAMRTVRRMEALPDQEPVGGERPALDAVRAALDAVGIELVERAGAVGVLLRDGSSRT